MKIEEAMKKELEKLELKVKQNQIEYKTLLKQYAIKKRAFNAWTKPLVQPNIPQKSIDETPRYKKEENREDEIN